MREAALHNAASLALCTRICEIPGRPFSLPDTCCGLVICTDRHHGSRYVSHWQVQALCQPACRAHTHELLGKGAHVDPDLCLLGVWLRSSGFAPMHAVVPRTGRATVSMKVEGMVGDSAPLGFFDPLGFSKGATPEKMKLCARALAACRVRIIALACVAVPFAS